MENKMKIKFSCSKHCQDFERTEEQLRAEHPITHCPFCGEKLKITNLEEIILLDCEIKIKEYIDLWVSIIGWDNTLDLILKHKDEAIGRLYIAELNRRGFKIK